MKSRKGSRGAALAEAMVVMATILVFLGFYQWFWRSYERQHEAQAKTRLRALSYAVHACQGGGDGASRDSQGGLGMDTPLQDKKGDPGIKEAMSGSMTNVRFDETTLAIAGGRIREVQASSSVRCNEVTHAPNYQDWMKFGLAHFKGGLF